MNGENTAAEPKKKIVRESFMGEQCTNAGCLRPFKIQKDYNQYKLTCPYCAKKVESTRILKQQLGEK